MVSVLADIGINDPVHDDAGVWVFVMYGIMRGGVECEQKLIFRILI
jgi:hypothetical protein